MPLINTTIYPSGKQNFLVPSGNTNSFDNDLLQNSAIFSEEGVASGFHIAQTTSPSNQVQIRFSPLVASKDGKLGSVVVKTPSNEFLVLALRSATAINVDVPENLTAFTRYDLICIYADFRTAAANNFSIKYYSGDTVTDPDLDAWNAANSGQILLPIARIAKTPGSLVDSSQIILSGQTTYNVNKSVRATTKYIAGSIKVMTEAERNASSWNSGDLCLVKAALDVNNTLHINTSTTATPLWKQIVLLAQLASQWVLLLPKALGTTNGTTAIAEVDGTGSFTLPANFWGVGTVLEITDTAQMQGTILLVTAGVFVQTNNVNINGTLLYASSLTCNWNMISSGTYIFKADTLVTFTKKTTIVCIAATSTTAQLQITTQNLINPAYSGSPGITNNFSTTTTTTIQTITQNVPMVISTNFVRTGISSWSSGTPTNNLTVFTIEKQT